jgi:pimeloyl-ACP methyl ester carboxylesterase
MGGSRSLPARLARGVGKWLLLLLCLVLLLLAALRIAAALREQGAELPAGMTQVGTPLGAVAVALSGPEDGTPVLLVHGTAAWSGFWKDVAAHLASEGWRVIAVDLPPFGWSEHDEQARYDRISQAERLAFVLTAVAKKPAVVVGHSFGGGPATELALRHPERLRSLVLVDAALGALDGDGRTGTAGRLLGWSPIGQAATAATVTNPMATGALLRSMIARKEKAEAWLPVLRRPMRREGSTSAYAAWLPFLFRTNDGALSRTRAGLSAIRVPVALIWGEVDTVTPLAQGRNIQTLTRARSFALLAGTGHIPHIEDPEHFLPALDAALAPDRREE